jgi:hypothetical protein
MQLKAYWEAYTKFVYVSPSTILKDTFVTSYFNQLEASTSGETL